MSSSSVRSNASPRAKQGTDYLRDQTDNSQPWGTTENYLMKHDTEMVKDYADDVDTLLVFAGLFSAVLTAFVVESYQLLQADNEENTVKLLSRISLQLESFTLRNGFLNSTAPALPLPPPFEPDKSTLWVNILWFLSLVFSLSAALFGILVKQWLREYLRWNSTLGSPRENVLVRQVRFEAWNEWNMAPTISCIPALLEVALIFFVCGLVVLVWSLDPALAIVITVAVAIFLSIVSCLTLLPAFFKRCPYKSPTAWAFALLWDFVVDCVLYARNAWRLRSADALYSRVLEWRLTNWHSVALNWRARDLASICPSRLPDGDGVEHDALVVMHDEIEAEREGFRGDGDDLAPDEAKNVLTFTSTIPVLLHALSWVSSASQDPRIQDQVVRCVQSLHLSTPVPPPLAEIAGRMRNISIWQLIYDLSRDEIFKYSGIRTPRKSRAVFAMRDLIQESYRPSSREDGYHLMVIYQLWPDEYEDFFQYHSPWEFRSMCHMVASCFRTTVIELVMVVQQSDVLSTVHCAHERRVMELLVVLRALFKARDGISLPACISALSEGYNMICKSGRGEFDHRLTSLRCCVLEVACSTGLIDISPDGTLTIRSMENRAKYNSEYLASLAVKLRPKCETKADYHIAVKFINSCLVQPPLSCDCPTDISTETASALLDTMCDILDASLAMDLPNCGYDGNLPWLKSVTSMSPMVKFMYTVNPVQWQRLTVLLWNFVNAGLVTGSSDEQRAYLHACVRLHERGEDSEDTETETYRTIGASDDGSDGLTSENSDATSPAPEDEEEEEEEEGGEEEGRDKGRDKGQDKADEDDEEERNDR